MSNPSLLTQPLSSSSSSSSPSESAADKGGKLSATILSVYDIPTGKDGACSVPSHVSMSVLGKEVQTGKPSAKHKLMNNFKFVSNNKSSPGT